MTLQAMNVKLSIVGNFAREKGGGISFDGSSKLHGPSKVSYVYSIVIENNRASLGSDIHLDDYTNTQACDDSQISATPCFFQTPWFNNSDAWKGSVKIGNKDVINSIILYGGLLHRCTVKIQRCIF